jgi:hypothetical protein
MLHYFVPEDRRTCSKGQFYTYRRPNNILWFQGIRQRMGFTERRAEGTGRGGSNARAIHLDPAEPSGVMDYTFAPQNAAAESGMQGIEIVLGERFATEAPTTCVEELSADESSATRRKVNPD